MFASPSLIGDVVVNDVRDSITKETVDKYFRDSDVGVGITNIASTGTAHTITSVIDHGLNRVTSVSIVSGGAGYGSGSAGDLYNARLVSIGSSTTGKHATAKITFDSGGTITEVKIMDGGSAYGIGNTLAVVGVETTSGYSQAVVQVSNIYNNVGDSMRVLAFLLSHYRTIMTCFASLGLRLVNPPQLPLHLQPQSLESLQQVLVLPILRTLTSTSLAKHCVSLHWITPAAVVLQQLLPQTAMV